MKNIEDINKAAVEKILSNKKFTEFSPGDTVKVGVKIVEGKRERIQFFEGVCVAKKNRNINSSFTVTSIPIFFLIFSAILADLPVLSLR